MKIRNRKTIRHLSWKVFLASRTRNVIAAIAIALTAMMFSALFTIALTMNYTSQQQTMRQVGGYSHGGFKRLTKEQAEELRRDDLIKESGATFLFSTPKEKPFDKIWAEMRYAEENYAKFCWSLPTKGKMPEKKKEIAMDTMLLEALKIPEKLGEKVTLTFPLGEETVTDTFTLCGYWEADPALPAHMIWLDQDYVVSEMAEVPQEIQDMQGVGDWYLDIVFADSQNIKDKLEQIAGNHGYTLGNETRGTELAVGINWAYTSSRTENMDVQSVASVIGALVLMLLTGYLIIYNVFQISVGGDIRFYGLLKTIGTTGRQIRRIVRFQALILSGIGIPIGLLMGYGAGNLLLPVIMKNMENSRIYYTANPWIFVGAGFFALVTVFISCFLPARHAAKVSPVEAVRYTEQSKTGKKKKKSRKGNRIFKMAWANLMRNKLKTVLVVLSLALSIVMLNGVYGFTKGFSMDGFLKKFVVSDFLVADADYFHYGNWDEVSKNLADNLASQEGFEDGGYVRMLQTYAVAETPKNKWMHWMKKFQRMAEDEISPEVRELPEDSLIEMDNEIYILDEYTRSHLEVLEGSLENWDEPGSVVQLVTYDDYGNVDMNQKIFDTGETYTQIFSDDYTVSENGAEVTMNTKQEEKYTVIATAAIPGIMTSRAFGLSKFAIAEKNVPESMRGYLTNMIYMADFTEEGAKKAEKFMESYTEQIEPEMSYESKGKYAGYYHQFQTVFWMVGGSLSFIIGLVGILNFMNGEVTSILSRKREMAILQSIGMTGKQMKQMLILEGILTVCIAVFLAVLLNLGVYEGLMPVIENLYWYFKRNFTLAMIFASVPVLLIFGIGIPVLAYKRMAEKSVVERLRESEM